jgi:hypothetical protein
MGKLASPWDEICIAHMLVVVHTKDNNPEEAYKEEAILVTCVSILSRLCSLASSN